MRRQGCNFDGSKTSTVGNSNTLSKTKEAKINQAVSELFYGYRLKAFK